jgi:hypothetical protein
MSTRPSASQEKFVPQMNYWKAMWDLDPRCPCDVHFNDWVKLRKLKNKLIYHFGTGMHHVVGRKQATGASNNVVFAITASKEEYAAYIELAIERPKISKNYLAYFGDIYLTNPRLLPDFDVVTLFHLCEYFHPANKAYGGIDDAKLLDILTAKTRRGGFILFFTGSFAFPSAEKIIAKWEKTGRVKRVGAYKTLLVFRKVK